MTARERLNRYLSRCGVASRRNAEGMISDGRIAVNGRVVRELGSVVDPARDNVTVDGRKVLPPRGYRYYALNKPSGYLCSRGDPFGRPTVYDILPADMQSLKYVGRLDYDTEGLLLFTDDGALIEMLTHPRYGLRRVYLVLVADRLSDLDVQPLRRGVSFGGVSFQPAAVRIVRTGPGGSLVRVEIREGKKREVRMMFRAIGRRIQGLRRVSFGPIELGGLPPGAHRRLSAREVALLNAKSPA